MTEWLIFIGAGGSHGLYSPQSFIDEAQRLGVSRAVPTRIARFMSVGDRVYCAVYMAREFDYYPRGERGYHRAKYRGGDALVFGYFIISGINVHGADEACMKQLEEKGLVGKAQELNQLVVRNCGGYIIANVRELKVKELRPVIDALPKGARVMITGELVVIKPELVVRNVNFSRLPMKFTPPEPYTALREVPAWRLDPELGELSAYERRFHPAKKRLFSWMRKRKSEGDAAL